MGLRGGRKCLEKAPRGRVTCEADLDQERQAAWRRRPGQSTQEGPGWSRVACGKDRRKGASDSDGVKGDACWASRLPWPLDAPQCGQGPEIWRFQVSGS